MFKELDLQFVFTTTRWWQVLKSGISALFRDPNYEPQVIFNCHRS
nr:phospholipase A [uncultured Paraglaciecola sp.]